MGQLALGSTFKAKEKSYVTVTGSAIPVILPSSGSITTAGVITITTALPRTYSGGCWLYLPAGTVVDGLAGLYYAVMSSTTAGQVYTNYVAAATSVFTPFIPDTLVAAVGSNTTYTTLTTAATLSNVVVPGGLMGADGECVITGNVAMANNANAKTLTCTFGSMGYMTAALASNLTASFHRVITNRGVKTAQVTGAVASLVMGSANATANVIGTENTGADVTMKVTGTLADAGDYIIIDMFQVQCTDA